MEYWLNFVILLGFCTVASSSTKGAKDKGWLRVCNSGNDGPHSTFQQHYEVEADKCPHGAWFSEGLQGSCVCLNGVWAISNSWCDEDYYVAYGNGHCFKLKSEIQKLSYIGHIDNSFEPLNFITKENGHVFKKFSKEFHMPYEHSRDTNRTIIRLQRGNRNGFLLELKPNLSPEEELLARVFQIHNFEEDDQDQENEMPVCVDAKATGSQLDENLMIHKINTRIQFIKSQDQCGDVHHGKHPIVHKRDFLTSLRIVPGEAVHVKSGAILKSSQSCPVDCKTDYSASSTSHVTSSSPLPLIRHKRQAKKKDKKDKEEKKKEEKEKEAPPPPPSEGFEPLELDREFTEEERDEMVNTANLRVVKQELTWLLEGVRPPTIDTQNWKLMQKIKEIFAKVCPEEETPTFLVNAFLRLFRLFYQNSRDFYPNGHMIEEAEQYERLNVTLDACLTEAEEFTFEYAQIKIEGEPCRTDADEEDNEITYCPCKEELDMLNVTVKLNATSEPESFNLTGVNATLPEHLRFFLKSEDVEANSTYRDFPTETVWKMISFVHLYCSKHFRYHGGDHSALMTKMEDFFNEDIIYRWSNPGKNADKVWQFLYSAFDLKRFAHSVDACLAGAKFISEYPEFLNRPTLSMTRRKKRSLDSQKLWSGHAYCLEDPWDPVNKLGVPNSEKCFDFNRF